MALVLSLGIGDVVDIAARWVSLLSVESRESATLINSDGRKITVSADKMTEMAPDVWVGLGHHVGMSRLRILFDAPRHVPISRRHQ